ncbi:MAG: hypothetical protein PHR16_16965 [Methylovulum sp.]|nr:hypothetical protein [Methylovulum sp.]
MAIRPELMNVRMKPFGAAQTRFIRIDGQGYENWLCAAYTAIPSETTSQWQVILSCEE